MKVQYRFELKSLLFSSILIFFLNYLPASSFTFVFFYSFYFILAKLAILYSWSPNLCGFPR